MCIKKILVTNNSHYFDPLSHKVVNKVNCGKCWQCLQMKRNGYVIRCYYEHLETIKKGGFTLFYTLTYNNDNLPNYHGIDCFDKKQVQTFLKRLRYYVTKKGYDFKYLLTCEYGDKLHRPHYHVLFFVFPVDKSLSPCYLTSHQFLNYIRTTWSYGFICPGQNLGVVTDITAINYVCKYVTKSSPFIKVVDEAVNNKLKREIFQYWFNKTNSIDGFIYIKNMDDDLKSEASMLREHNVSPEETIKIIARKYAAKSAIKTLKAVRSSYDANNAPFVLISKGVGQSAIKEIDKVNYTIKLPHKNGYKVFNIPLYYYRKLLFDVKKDLFEQNRYVLNEVGKEFLIRNFERSLMELKCKYDSFLSPSILNKDFINWLNDVKGYPTSVENIKYMIVQLNDYTQSFMHYHWSYALAIYKKVYEHRPLVTVPDTLDKDLYDLSGYPEINYLQDYVDTLYPLELEYSFLTPQDADFFINNNNYSNPRVLNYDSHPCFAKFSNVNTLIDYFEEYINVNTCRYNQDNENLIFEIRHLFPNQITPFTPSVVSQKSTKKRVYKTCKLEVSQKHFRIK